VIFLRGLFSRRHEASRSSLEIPGQGCVFPVRRNLARPVAEHQLMLHHTFKALRPGGHLVVVDREPKVVNGEPNAADREIRAASVESELRRRGFEILTREKSFIDRPGEELWWLIVARRPEAPDLGLLGESRVNMLKLNWALGREFARK
jgi:hypothetical protein